MPNVSFCTVVHNVGDSIEGCLRSARPLVDEVICWDQSSDDGTSDIASELADLHIVVPYKGNVYTDYMDFRKVARYEWILSYEASDLPSGALMDFIKTWREAPIEHVSAFWAMRQVDVDGVDIAEIIGCDYQLVLWRAMDPGGSPTAVYRDMTNSCSLEVRTPYQMWLHEDQRLVSKLRFDDLVQEHLLHLNLVQRERARRPSLKQETQFLLRLSRLLDRALPLRVQDSHEEAST